jgi:hypothetical protein
MQSSGLPPGIFRLLSFLACCLKNKATKKNLIFVLKSVKNIDWEQFITNTLANNFVLHMRLFKKSKDKLNTVKQSVMQTTGAANTLTPSQQQLNDDNHVIEAFFDLEADIERGICRDEVCNGTNGREHGIFMTFR